MPTSTKTDIATIAAIAILAMCIVTSDHEAIGHGSACLALGGKVVTLTSSVFRCNPSTWLIAPAGPAFNILVGAIALTALRFVPNARVRLRLFLILMTAFSWFWEGGYAVQAMVMRHGDLYFGGRGLFGTPDLWWRVTGGLAGVALYISTWILTARALACYSRTVVITAWSAATMASVAAAVLCTLGSIGDIHDAFTEIGLASIPLLAIARRVRTGEPQIVARGKIIIGLACCVYALFAATLGRGLFMTP
ncbi:hypothetical protein AEAC466_20395 [Asticcacaulis sp. AC466]|uniref:hypothetical protein n=1 Tax=Asticcacaulis sp. AC466 TaxID=1282362 RepID=UPI0003C3E453|nr:hypothetical protein [Asticcacaulis sp. AC466]ESQ81785.1 hypothetical protein AEAC466_20395 [Asticcacaulis sp. AC466]